jgi:CxxC motif-containing protein (DUF1111 family)
MLRVTLASPIPGGLGLAAVVLLVAGCETHRHPLSTAPSNASELALATLAMSDSALLNAHGSAELSTRLGGPLAGLDGADLARFEAGLEEFSEEETVEDGLGPVFNDASCKACHNGPVGGTNGRPETRFGRWVGGAFDPMVDQGGSLIQDHAIGLVNTEHGAYTFTAEAVPREATVSALRITTPLFGLGLVDAVSDAALIALADLQARNFPSTRGTPHLVTDRGTTRVGRFGWKAQVATLRTFSGDAYLNEMGITSPDFPEENYPQGNREPMLYNPVPALNDDGGGVEKFFDFMTLLGPPPRGSMTRQSEVGATIFQQIGCANCHTPTLVTGDSPVPALSHRTFQPFSDFLLHDMGSLGDGIVQGGAGGRQMRTAPLWGLKVRPTFLHDGRARTPNDAILEHAGQGTESRNRYTRLAPRDRQALLAFLRSL